MNIDQLRKIAKLTKSKKSIELLIDEDEFIIKNIIMIVDKLKKEDVVYNEDEINEFIELTKKGLEEHESFDKDICTIITSMTNTYNIKEEPNINDINSVIKLYITEEYNGITVDIIKKFKPLISIEDFKKLYEALKSVDFQIKLDEFSAINKNNSLEFIPTRTIDEICNLIREDNGLTPKQIYETYFDIDILKYRTYEETKSLGNKIMEAYNSEEYKDKVKKYDKGESADIELIAIDSMLLTHMTNQEHLSIMDEFINDPSDGLYKIISNRDVIEHRNYNQIIELINLYKTNNNNYEIITNHKLLLQPFEVQIEYLNILNNTKSPYIKDLVLNSEEPITEEFTKKIKKLDEPITLKEELISTSIDEFINSLEDNGIEDFDSTTQVYVKRK